MALFVGEFDQTIDEKRRLAISSALREGIDPETDGQEFYLVLGTGRHLWLYPDRYYERLARTMKSSLLPSHGGPRLELYFAMARRLKPDAQGRVVLPDKSVQRAVIDHEVVLLGQKDHIEIWPKREWESFMDEHLPTYAEALLAAGDALAQQAADDESSRP